MILLNLGGPDSVEAIRPFLLNLFSDRSIIKLPLQPLLARIIAWRRTKKVVGRYQAIGGGSPLRKLTEEQARLLEKNLEDHGLKCRVYIGMSYWHPYIHEAVDQIIEDGYKQVLGVSLFPHFSRATTGACLRELEKALDQSGSGIKPATIESWHENKDYLDAVAERVQAGLNEFTEEQRQDLMVLFSAHSLPQEFVNDGDPYPEHIETTIEGVLERIGTVIWRLSYQSRSGPVKWLEPQTDDMIRELGRTGTKNLLIVPISFVSDHIETLYEIDVMYKELAESSGIEVFERSPSLNNSDLFIKALAGIVRDKVGADAK